VATKEKLKDRDAAVARAKTMLIPGIVLQPSGVFAVLRAQEAGCNYILAS
jgi:intracellular sulfur oxidation DsrE/DsrF family protein